MTLFSGPQPSATLLAQPNLQVGSFLDAEFTPEVAGSKGRDGLQTLPALQGFSRANGSQSNFHQSVVPAKLLKTVALPLSTLAFHIPSLTHYSGVSTSELLLPRSLKAYILAIPVDVSVLLFLIFQ